ncbi:factor associated with metabolism and energy isoform 3-T3 [Megaptera novaeangliae]
MGLSHSKAHPRVTKVAPLQNKEEETPSAVPVDFVFTENPEEKSSYSFARLQERNKALEGQLPPLRETCYGRYSAAPRAMYFDIPLEQGETSIIKRHPPRRLQKLEPIDLPQVITSERLLSQQEVGRTHKAKQELEKKMQTLMYPSGKRQYLHKMQMLEMNRKRQEAQVELKTSLHKEARTNKQKQRDHKVKKILQSIPRNDDGDFLTLLPDETLNRSPGEKIHRMQNFWNNKQVMTIVPRKLASWKHGSVNKRLMDSFSGTVPAPTQMSWGKSRRNHEHW